MILQEKKNEEIITHKEKKEGEERLKRDSNEAEEIIPQDNEDVDYKTKNVDKMILRENICAGVTLSTAKQLVENNISNLKNETCYSIESSNMGNVSIRTSQFQRLRLCHT